MKNFNLCLASLSFVVLTSACGSKTDDKTAAPSTAWKNTGMQSIVSGSCAISGCHVTGSQLPNYAGISEAAMKADKTARDEIASGDMPKTGSLTTAQKTTVAGFYTP